MKCKIYLRSIILFLDLDERVYEPVILSESVSQNVDKKIARYKRLAAKKETKSNRHKSPDARASRPASKSRSPSPGSSLSEGGLGTSRLSDPETEPGVANQAPTLSPFPNNAQIIVGVDAVDESQPVGGEGVEHRDFTRDEGEYNSSPDTEDESEEEEISEEIEESIEEDDSRSEEQLEEENDGSSEEEEEIGLIEGAYEEINVNHSSDFEIYNNKDTENKILMPGTNDSTKHFVPSPLEKLEVRVFSSFIITFHITRFSLIWVLAERKFANRGTET